MEQIELQRAIEAILFAAGEPVEIAQLSHVLEADEKDVISGIHPKTKRTNQQPHAGVILPIYGRKTQREKQ